MSSIHFTGRVAVITGAGAGLGREYAIELAKRGAQVVVNDVGGAINGIGTSHAAADQVVEEIRAFGGEAVASYESVATGTGGEHIIGTAIEAFGKVDILINNAGIVRDKAFVNMEEESWDTVMSVHLKGAYCVSKPAFKNMKEHRYGRVVMTASGAGLFGNFGQANYGAAKMALVGLTNTLRLEGERYGIKVNAVVPNAATRMSEGAMTPEMLAKLKTSHVTPAVLYLCSEECAASGVYINVFGGYISRSAILTGAGVTGIETPEQVRENWSRIVSMENPAFHNSLPEMVTSILDNDLIRKG
jgi:NAD(P)-dependent dehydrogenase (short-subunit alcohol dehydrogenase family)